jgi:hypothetical protein
MADDSEAWDPSSLASPPLEELGVKRKPRVRMHLVDEQQSQLPSVEGILVSRRRHEYMIALPTLLVAPGANPAELDSRWLCVPRSRVAFYEVL